MRQSGWPQILPSRSWSAPSTAHLAAIWPGSCDEAVEDRPGRERIVTEQRPHVLEDPGMGGVGPLVVVLVRSALAVADQTVVRDRDLDDPGVRVGRAGDDERLEVLERDDPRVELHRRQRIRPVRPRPVESSPRACSSGDRACASGAQGRRFDSYQAHPADPGIRITRRNPHGYAEKRRKTLPVQLHRARKSPPRAPTGAPTEAGRPTMIGGRNRPARPYPRAAGRRRGGRVAVPELARTCTGTPPTIQRLVRW